jgi:hypothetical protein
MASEHLGLLLEETQPGFGNEVPTAEYTDRLKRIGIGAFGLIPVERSSSLGVPVLGHGEMCAFTLNATNPKQHLRLPTAAGKGSQRVAVHIESKIVTDSYLVIEPPPGETIDGSTSPMALVMPHDSVVLIADAATSGWHVEHISQIHENINGFFSRAESALSFDNASRTLTLEPVADEFLLFSDSRAFILDGVRTAQIPDTAGLHFFWVDKTGALQTSQAYSEDYITRWALVAFVYWDSVNGEAVVFGDERHGSTMPASVHLWAHHALGTQYDSGLALTDLVADDSGDLDVHAQLGYTSGVIRDEDITFAIGAQAAPATIPVLYREGADGHWVRKTPDSFPVVTTGTGRLAWNEWTGSEWKLTEASNNNFVLLNLVATNDLTYPVMALVGQAEYSTKGQAQDAAPTEINTLRLGGLELLYTEFTEIATIIFQTGSGYDNAVKARVVSTAEGADYIDFRRSAVGGGAAAAPAEAIKPFILMPSIYDVMEDDEVILEVVVPETFTIPAGAPQSYGNVFGTPAAASTVISVQKNNVEVATFTFALGALTATVACAADTTFTVGLDKLTIKGPATADAALAGVTLALRGIR